MPLVRSFLKTLKAGGTVLGPLNPLAAGPWFYLDSRHPGYAGLNNGDPVPTIWDASGNGYDLIESGGGLRATWLTGGSPFGINLIRLPDGGPNGGACNILRTHVVSEAPGLAWPANTAGYTFYHWFTYRNHDRCENAGTFVGYGDTTRPAICVEIGTAFAPAPANRIGVRHTGWPGAGGFVAFGSSQPTAETDGAGRGVHILAFTFTSNNPNTTARCWLDGTEQALSYSTPGPFRPDVNNLNGLQFGAQPTTTPAASTSRCAEADFGAAIIYPALHSDIVRRRISLYLAMTWGRPLGYVP